jgi:hypothetical protein
VFGVIMGLPRNCTYFAIYNFFLKKKRQKNRGMHVMPVGQTLSGLHKTNQAIPFLHEINPDAFIRHSNKNLKVKNLYFYNF